MKVWTVSAAAWLLKLATAVSAAAEQPELTPEWLRTSAGNSSLFTRWRPRSHFISPHSWMNDPCGAVYDPATDTYHLSYQFHPNHVNWGNISWGHAVSKDLLHWRDFGDWANDSSVSLARGQFPSNTLSQFTGTTQPVNITGERDGSLLTFATGIHALPTNWKIPYIEGTEIQALYLSSDGGASWSEVETAISSPPEGWNVTGWRDPSFFPSPELDSLLGAAEPHYYMVLGSGLKSGSVPAELPGAARPGFIGPRMPLYAAPASNLTDWSFLGALWEPAANSSLGEPDVTGSYGYNFEVSGFFDLPIESSSERAWFVTMGAEGGNTTSHLREQWALWNRGSVSARTNGSVEFTPGSGGAVDWGLSYAQATFVDSKPGNGDRRVLYGWANEDIEDDWNFYVARAMGYAGALTLPQELFVKETRGLLRTDYADGNQWAQESRCGASHTAQTLGIRPLPDVLAALKAGAAEELSLDVGSVAAAVKASDDLTDSFILTATLSLPVGAADQLPSAGIVLAQSPDNAEFTTVVLDPAAATVSVRRDNSSALPVFRSYAHSGHFAPYRLASGSDAGAVEDVTFTIVYDRSLLEVFVNDRFALTSRIYPTRADSTGLSFFAGELDLSSAASSSSSANSSSSSAVQWKDVKVWKGLPSAWPERPDDTSVPLLWDTPEETNNAAWWPGW